MRQCGCLLQRREDTCQRAIAGLEEILGAERKAQTPEGPRQNFDRFPGERGWDLVHLGGTHHAMTSELQALADRQWRDYRDREPGTCFSDLGFTLDLARAYELQDAVTALRISTGDRLVGYKVGCTGAGTVQQFGMEGPIRGCLFESEVRRHRETLDFHDFASLAIEGEMALRLGTDGTIAAVFPVIELHHFVFRGGRETLGELVANNGLNGGFVLPLEGWPSSQDYVERRGVLSVRINGRLIASGELWPLPGGVRASLEWLRNHLTEAGLALLGTDRFGRHTPRALSRPTGRPNRRLRQRRDRRGMFGSLSHRA
jgi:2-keto-4-pentenoate hydratase